MKVLKFGGSSVGSAERIKSVIEILKSYHKNNEKIAVVFSAFQTVTDNLLKLSEIASKQDSSYLGLYQNIRLKHFNTIEELIPAKNSEIKERVELLFKELHDLIHGIYLLKDISPRIKDLVVSFGERLSNTIIAEAVNHAGITAEYLDASKLVKTNDNYGSAKVLFEQTNKNISDYFALHDKMQIITGFIASTIDNEITTLGRGGSDYTAAIFGAALNAEEIEIWTDVNGIMTADPRKVKNAIPLKAVTYQEAMEMSYFGAKVIHPPTMQPALEKNIKIRIRNTFNPSFKGTVILSKEPHLKFSAKGISSIENISLIRIEGSGLAGSQEIVSRVFKALSQYQIPVLIITQGSSGISLCVGVLPETTEKAKVVIENELRLEILDKIVNKIYPETELSLIAVVGEDMRETPGISGKVFQALGKNGVNLKAIAQGSSELNISFVIKKIQLSKALNVIHDAMFLSTRKELNIFIIGTGLVGSAFIEYIKEKKEFLFKKLHSHANIIGIANSKKMYFDVNGIDLLNWKDSLLNSEIDSNIESFINTMREMNLANSIFIDCTATDKVLEHYEFILDSNISVITPNKIANTLSFEKWETIRNKARKNNVQFMYSTNVGAGLPVIDLIQGLIQGGEEIIKIEGVLSGTLSYILNSFEADKKFSDIVFEAKEKGFTEPDPRDDLNGLDMARKLLILIRESGVKMELSEIEVESLVPENARDCSIDEFMQRLKENENHLMDRNKSAINNNKVLRYYASYKNGKAKVGLNEIDSSHPFFNLKGTENIVLIETKNHSPYPLVIRGKGAGAEYTAFGIFSDLIKVSKYLG
ncbi:MAG: bifunctional aspartate kinase/homoserine dehydrogenase I [Melioribacteraceae bacterium]|nr:bifunctional aspartate kinase/homoserine dehydrogenase I [Melioribacteraceae bacterium]